LKDDQATNGCFEELEDWLGEHGIPFDRHSDGHCELDAENVSFRPGMKEPAVHYATNSGEGLFPRAKAEAARDALKAGRNAEALTILEEELGGRVPELPPLKLGE
jgi:hypothetical protein